MSLLFMHIACYSVAACLCASQPETHKYAVGLCVSLAMAVVARHSNALACGIEVAVHIASTWCLLEGRHMSVSPEAGPTGTLISAKLR